MTLLEPQHTATTASEEPAATGMAAPGEARAIGRVVSVSGSQVICLLDEEDTQDVANPTALQIGALVKVETLDGTVFGMVSGLSIPIPSREGGADE